MSMINLDDKIKQLVEQGQRFNEQSQHIKDLEYKNSELQQELEAQREETIKCYSKISETQLDKELLQEKIDKALERANHACIGIAMFHKQFNDVINILRGEGG